MPPRPPPGVRADAGDGAVQASIGWPFSQPVSYVAHDEPLGSPEIVHFNHGLGEVITAVMNAGMTLTAIEEHNTVPWNPLDETMEDVGGGEYRLRSAPDRLAATSTLQATRSRR